MTALSEQLDDIALARLARVRATSSTPVPDGRFRVSRVAGRVVVVRDGGGLVLDVDPAAATRLARQLDDAAGEPR